MNPTKKAACSDQHTPEHRVGHKDDERPRRQEKLTRRDLLGKAAYVAPALTVFGTVSNLAMGAGSVSLGPPPDPPGTQSDFIRMEHHLLQQEQVPAGPDPLELFSKDAGN